MLMQAAKCLVLLGVALTFAGCNDDESPLTDGGFETPRVKAPLGYDVYAPGQHIGPWEVHVGKVDLVGKYWKAAAGTQSLNLQGAPGVRSWISQTLVTQTEKLYQLRLAMSGNPDNGSGMKKLEIWWGDQLVDTPEFEVTPAQTHEQMGWKALTYKVRAKAPRTQLKLLSAVDEPWGPVVDLISVKAID